MGKVIVNNKEVAPTKKVKLFKVLSRANITALIKQKQEEQKRGRQQSGQ